MCPLVGLLARYDSPRTGLDVLGTAARKGDLEAVQALVRWIQAEKAEQRPSLNPPSRGPKPPEREAGAPLLHMLAVMAHEGDGALETLKYLLTEMRSSCELPGGV